MPIYAYRCDSCGVRKDVLQKLSDAPLTQCPDCGAPSFQKELSAPAFQLKGSGWYATDFRDQGKSKDKAAAGAEQAAASSGDASGGKTNAPDAAGAATPSAATSSPAGASTSAPAGTASPAP